MSILSVRQLKKSYGDHELLRNLSLDLEAGEHVALVGNNGAGKSTLLHLLAGMEAPDSGQIRLLPPTLRIALLEQCPLPEGGSLTQEPLFRACLSALGMDVPFLPALESSRFSGGEQMKLALSRLLGQEPDLLLLDEPTNHLDLNGVEALIELLNGFPGTLLIVSHDRYFLDCTVSCVWELEDGCLRTYPGNYTDYRNEKARLFEESLHR